MKVSIETPDFFHASETGIIHPRDGRPVDFTVIRSDGAFCVRTASRFDPDTEEELTCGGPARTEERILVINARPEDLAEWAAAEVRAYYERG